MRKIYDKDMNGRVLHKNEIQERTGKNKGRYKYFYDSSNHYFTAWTLKELREKEDKYKKACADGINIAGAKRSFAAYYLDYLDGITNRVEVTTLGEYRKIYNTHIKKAPIGKKAIGEISVDDMCKFYANLAHKGLSNSRIRTINKAISPCIKDAIERKFRQDNPCPYAVKNYPDDTKERIPLTVKQTESLLEFMQKSKTYAPYYPAVLFALSTGVRGGELLGLTWKDIDLSGRKMQVNQQLKYIKDDKTGKYKLMIKPPKYNSVRTVPLCANALQALELAKADRMKHRATTCDGYSDFVFVKKNGELMPVDDFDGILRRLRNQFNEKNPDIAIEQLPSHIFRHTFATRCVEKGMNPKVLQKIMGHKNIQVTLDIYVNLSNEFVHDDFLRVFDDEPAEPQGQELGQKLGQKYVTKGEKMSRYVNF